MELYQSHDKFFKATFSIPEVAKEYLMAFLPPIILEKMNLEEMVLDDNSYINDSLSAYYTDLVWIIPYNKQSVNVALLFEHKTYPSTYIHLQLLRYQLEMWERCVNDKKALIPIIPIVIYQSKRKWVKRSFKKLFKGIDSDLLPFFPEFDYLRTDTNIESQQVLAQVQGMHALAVFKTMHQVIQKYLDEGNLIVFFQEISHIITNDPVQEALAKRIIIYVFTHSDAKPLEIIEKINRSQNQSNFMSSLDQLLAIGRAEGEAKGKAEGKAEGEAKGKAEGKAEGLHLTAKIIKLYIKGEAPTTIAEKLNTDTETVEIAIAEYNAD